MTKSTINLGDVLDKLTSPMEKVANMSEGKTDELESKDAEVGKEKKVEEKKDEKVKSKESKEIEEEKKENDLEKEAAIKAAAEKVASVEKVASETPVSGLEKIAQDLAEAEHRTMVKEAQVFGSVMADSFANRLAEIQDVVDSSDVAIEKTAMDKTAAHDEYMTKVATELYINMDEKDQVLVNELVKVASENGMNITQEEAFSELAQQAIAMGEHAALEKVATEEAMTKLAGHDHARLDGFVKTAALMGEEITKEDAYNYMAKTAMEAGAQAAIETPVEKVATENTVEKTAEERNAEELEAMEKVAADLEAKGDTEGVAKLEKYAYEKGFEETLVKVAAHTSSIGYVQTEALMNS